MTRRIDEKPNNQKVYTFVVIVIIAIIFLVAVSLISFTLGVYKAHKIDKQVVTSGQVAEGDKVTTEHFSLVSPSVKGVPESRFVLGYGEKNNETYYGVIVKGEDDALKKRRFNTAFTDLYFDLANNKQAYIDVITNGAGEGGVKAEIHVPKKSLQRHISLKGYK